MEMTYLQAGAFFNPALYVVLRPAGLFRPVLARPAGCYAFVLAALETFTILRSAQSLWFLCDRRTIDPRRPRPINLVIGNVISHTAMHEPLRSHHGSA